MIMALILGIGNSLLSDDGAGIHAIRHLEKYHSDDDSIRFLDGGTIGFSLAADIASTNELIVIDATLLDQANGAIAVFEGEVMDDYLGNSKRTSVHEVGLRDLLSTSQLLDELPNKRALIGIQPKTLTWGEYPTEQVSQAIPKACQMALELIGRWRDE
jgi:hydrogenase maturation protease